MGLFVLFDIIVHSPLQPETASNLVLLDMAAGHFSLLEYRSGGTLPGSLISEFSHIARNYVNEVQHNNLGQSQPQLSTPAAVPNYHIPRSNMAQNSQQLESPIPNVDLASELFNPFNQGNEHQQSSYSAESASLQAPQPDLVYDGLEDYKAADALMGTDVMGIFNNFLPGLGPMFYQETADDFDFGQDFLQGDQSQG